MIEGYDTVQNTLDNIDSTNKYNLDTHKDDIPISIKKMDKKNDYVVLMHDNKYDSDNEIYFEIDDQTDKNATQPIRPNNTKLNTITTFYLSSLTVVGLFIFYRLIQRTK